MNEISLFVTKVGCEFNRFNNHLRLIAHPSNFPLQSKINCSHQKQLICASPRRFPCNFCVRIASHLLNIFPLWSGQTFLTNVINECKKGGQKWERRPPLFFDQSPHIFSKNCLMRIYLEWKEMAGAVKVSDNTISCKKLYLIEVRSVRSALCVFKL